MYQVTLTIGQLDALSPQDAVTMFRDAVKDDIELTFDVTDDDGKTVEVLV